MLIRLIDQDGAVIASQIQYPRIPNPGDVIEDSRTIPAISYRVVQVKNFTRLVNDGYPARTIAITEVVVSADSGRSGLPAVREPVEEPVVAGEEPRAGRGRKKRFNG